MRTRQPGIRHEDALDRRLALLGDELAWLRPDPPEAPPPGSPRPGAPGERRPAASARPWWDEHTRVASGADDSPGSAAVSGPATTGPATTPAPTAVGAWSGSDRSRVAVVPAPGRHAARRPPLRPEPDLDPRPVDEWAVDDRGLARGLAAARLLLGPAQLTVVAVIVVFALGVTCWWLARGRPESTVALQAAPASELTSAPSAGAGGGSTEAAFASQTPAPTDVGPTAPTAASAASAASASAGTVTVDVAGKVRRPGIQVLPAGSRIADAVTAAGGARPGVDLTTLNLAQVLADGQQVLVGVADDSGASVVTGPLASTGSTSSASSGTSGTSGTVQVVDLNTATADQLDTLPDVGPVTAQSILAWRDAHGGFTSVDELLEVDGIGQVTLGKLAPYVTV